MPRVRMFMRPSSMRSRTSVISIAQPTARTALVVGPHDAELRAALQALADHRAVALLEDVQRHELVGERDDAEREEREVAHDAVGHPGSVYGCRPPGRVASRGHAGARRLRAPLSPRGPSAAHRGLVGARGRAAAGLPAAGLRLPRRAARRAQPDVVAAGQRRGAGGRARRSCSAPSRWPTAPAAGR